MSARLARLALALYPLAYRRRYGAEMEALLEEGGATPATVVDLTRGALRAHLHPEPGVAGAVGREERLRRGLAAVLLCWGVFVVAGLALYKTTEGSPFEGGAGAPGVLGALHLAIQILAAIGSVAVLVGAAPFAMAALRGTPLSGSAALPNAPPSGSTAPPNGPPSESVTGEARGRSGTRRRLASIEPSRRALALASLCAAVVAAAMAGIAALTAAYLVALATDAPNLAGEPNGPFGTPNVAVSLALQLALMVAAAGPAALAALRARRTLAR